MEKIIGNLAGGFAWIMAKALSDPLITFAVIVG